MYCSSRRRRSLSRLLRKKRTEEEKESTNQLEKQKNKTKVFGVFCNRMT
jgi:hypothetical protein